MFIHRYICVKNIRENSQKILFNWCYQCNLFKDLHLNSDNMYLFDTGIDLKANF